MEQQSLNTTAAFDRAGMSASLACAVHCGLLPLALAALPALGLAWLDSPWVDWSMVVLALGIALSAHRGGYRTPVHSAASSFSILNRPNLLDTGAHPFGCYFAASPVIPSHNRIARR